MIGEPNFVKRERCPGCEATSHTTLWSSSFCQSPIKEYLEAFYVPQGSIAFQVLEGGRFILNECLSCGTIYQEEVLNDSLLRTLYEVWIDPQKSFEMNAQQIDDLAYFARYAEEIMMVMGYLRVPPSQLRFLDFGMGWGRWCKMAAAFGCETYGTELSESRMKYAESLGVKILSWEDIARYKFDFINAEQMMEHIPAPLDSLRYLKASLNARGLLKMSVPDGRDIKRRLRKMDWTAPKGTKNSLNPVAPLEHINCFNHTSIIRMADKAGLHLVKMPLKIQYGYSINWRPFSPMVKNIFKPIGTYWVPRGTRLFFRS